MATEKTHQASESFAFFSDVKFTGKVFVFCGVATFEKHLQGMIERIKKEGPGRGQEYFYFSPAEMIPKLLNGLLPEEGNVVKDEQLGYLLSFGISYTPKIYGGERQYLRRRGRKEKFLPILPGIFEDSDEEGDSTFDSAKVGENPTPKGVLQIQVSFGRDNFTSETDYISLDACDTEEGIRAMADAILRISEKLERQAFLDWWNDGSTQGL